MDNKEVAYHEAGHTVIGYLFYKYIKSTTIIPSNNRYGNTICEIPSFLTFEEFDNDLFFPKYVKIALYCWAGEYFQKTINPMFDIKGLENDKEIFEFYFEEKEKRIAFEYFKDSLQESFFTIDTLNKMIDDVATELLKKGILYQSDIELILSKYTFDFNQQIELLMNEYYIPICKYYNNLKINNRTQIL